MLSKRQAISNAVWLCIHHDPKIITARLQIRTALSASMPKIFTHHDGPCRLASVEVTVVPVPV